MSAIIHPLGNCLLYETGVDSYLDQEQQGFAYNDFMYLSLLVYQKKGQIDFDPERPNTSPISIVNETGKVTLTPYFANLPWVMGRDWEQVKGQWAAQDQLSSIGNRLVMYGEEFTTNEDETFTENGGEIKSKFRCPEYGGWQVTIRRTTPQPSDGQAYSYIKWSDYVLIIPYDATAGLFKSHKSLTEDDDVQEYDVRVGDPYFPDSVGRTDEEGITPVSVTYRNHDGKILLSGDGGTTNWIYEENDIIKVPTHEITLGHIAGPVEFEFKPIWYPQVPTAFYSTPIPLPYRAGGNLQTTMEFKPEATKPPGTKIEAKYNSERSKDTDDETSVVYNCIFESSTPEGDFDNPSDYGAEEGESLAGIFDLTPELDSVLVKHPPNLITSAIPYVDLAHPFYGERLINVQGEEAIDFDTSTWSVILNNEDGALSDAFSNVWLKPYKAMQVWGGYKYDDGTQVRTPMFTGVITTPTFSSSADRRHRASVRICNMAWLCQQVFNKGDWPMFDGFVMREALEWLASRCRISETRQLFTGSGEGTEAIGVNQKLSRGTGQNPLWHANVLETSAWEMMKKMADYIKYDLYFDRVANLICRPKQLIWDGTFQHRFYASPRDVADIMNYQDATDIELVYQGEDWYNAVYVGGYHRGGGVISTYKANWSSIYDPFDPHYIGFEKAVVVAYEAFVDAGKIQEITDIIYEQSLLFPRRISFTTYFNPIVEPGQVFEFTGSRHPAMGTDWAPKYYRIMNLSHNISIASLSTTSIVGELVGPIDEP